MHQVCTWQHAVLRGARRRQQVRARRMHQVCGWQHAVLRGARWRQEVETRRLSRACGVQAPQVGAGWSIPFCPYPYVQPPPASKPSSDRSLKRPRARASDRPSKTPLWNKRARGKVSTVSFFLVTVQCLPPGVTGVPRVVSLLFDLISVCLCRPECLSVPGLRCQ